MTVIMEAFSYNCIGVCKNPPWVGCPPNQDAAEFTAAVNMKLKMIRKE